MLKQLRIQIVQQLWQRYKLGSVQIQLIEKGLLKKGVGKLTLDHFATIDLPGPHTGIPHLQELFSAIGYVYRGNDYLADKQNDFLWMAESDHSQLTAMQSLPQIVVADFRPDELPSDIKKIIERYSQLATPSPVLQVQQLAARVANSDMDAFEQLLQLFNQYFSGRTWPLPTVHEFQTVHAFNELLAWVLVFGRRPNHFTLSVHLLQAFSALAEFNYFVEHELQIPMNYEGGIIKGNSATGIAQSSTMGAIERIMLADGFVMLPVNFAEFVWRYPVQQSVNPEKWQDFFTGFIGQNADHVIKSLYVDA